MAEPLGLSLRLTPQLVSELQKDNAARSDVLQRAVHRRENGDDVASSSSWLENDVQPKGLHVLNVLPVVTVEQDWDCVMPTSSGNVDGIDLENSSEIHQDDFKVVDASCDEDIDDDQDDEEEGASIDSTSSILSYSPPSSLPVVLVNVERLAGYVPSSPDEAQALITTIQTALWGEVELMAAATCGLNGDEKKDLAESDDTELEESMVVARDFDQRITDLFASGMARHSDTSISVASNLLVEMTTDQRDVASSPIMAIPYPEYVCRINMAGDDQNDSHDDANVQVLSTARVWKQLLQPHDIAVVDRLLQTLASCSRSLLWKLDMRREVVTLAASEEDDRQRREAECALSEWKSGRRQAQLEKLYAAREALNERYQQASRDQAVLEHERDVAVQWELRQRRRDQGHNGGIEAFDFASTVFAFPDHADPDLFLGLKDDDEDDGYFESPHLMESLDYESDNESQTSNHSDASASVQEQLDNAELVDQSERVGDNDTTIDRRQLRKERRQRAVRIRHQRLGEAAKEAEHKVKLDAAKLEEEHVRNRNTTLALKMAMALTLSLQAKLQEVDELLETIQEEQWADEEEAENSKEKGHSATVTDRKDTLDESHSQFSLLDQILAMILGATPPPDGIPLADHICELEQTHRSISDEWLAYFGRLPSALVSSPLPSKGELDDASQDWAAAPKGKVVTEQPRDISQKGMNTVLQPPETLRAALGIKDNDQDDWDVGEVESSCAAQPHQQVGSKASVFGFRPGGRS